MIIVIIGKLFTSIEFKRNFYATISVDSKYPAEQGWREMQTEGNYLFFIVPTHALHYTLTL